jgi:hypothetical protein
METAVLELAELDGLEQQELEQHEFVLGRMAAKPDTEVNEQRADDSVSGDPHALQNTKSTVLVGSRGPILQVNTL